MDIEILILIGKGVAGLCLLGAGYILLCGLISALGLLLQWMRTRGREIHYDVRDWVTAYLFMTLKAPFQMVDWLFAMLWLALSRVVLTIRAWGRGCRIRVEKRRDLRRMYLKHRAQFKNWRHFKRWVRDQEAGEDYPAARDAYAEALEMLGLEQGFTRVEFKTAYRRIASYVHPDKGCPTGYFAQKLNEAVSLINKRRNWR